MISDLVNRHPNKLYLGCILLALATGALWAFQNSGSHVLYCNQAAEITDAVMISNVSVAGNTVECGLFIKPPDIVQPVTPFQAGSDWLQQMTITLINRTNKTIVCGGIIFHFLDTGDCKAQPCAGVGLRFGQIPEIDAYDGRTGKPLNSRGTMPLNWGPEQVFTVHVGDYMNEIEHSLSNFLPVTDVTKVAIYRGTFYFHDGMKWSLGRYSVPDPAHPGKFNALPFNYFPGRRAHNWPPGYNR